MTLLPLPFGNPTTYKGHSGVDFPQAAGASVRASAPGVVLDQGYSPVTPSNPRAAGHWLTVGYDGGPAVFMCHFRDRSGSPRNGARVGEGTHLAPVGSTGFSTGNHLHLAIDGQPGYANVWKYFDPRRVVGSGSTAGTGAGAVVAPPPIDYARLRRLKEGVMYIRGTNNDTVYVVYTDANGKPRVRVAGANEASFAHAGGLVITGWDSTLNGVGVEAEYKFQVANPLPIVNVKSV